MNGQLQKLAELLPCSDHGKQEKDRVKNKGKKQRMEEGLGGYEHVVANSWEETQKKREGMEKSGKG